MPVKVAKIIKGILISYIVWIKKHGKTNICDNLLLRIEGSKMSNVDLEINKSVI